MLPWLPGGWEGWWCCWVGYIETPRCRSLGSLWGTTATSHWTPHWANETPPAGCLGHPAAFHQPAPVRKGCGSHLVCLPLTLTHFETNLKGEEQQTANVLCLFHGQLTNHMTTEEDGTWWINAVRTQMEWTCHRFGAFTSTLRNSVRLCLSLQSEGRLQWILHQQGHRDRRQIQLLTESVDTQKHDLSIWVLVL